MSMSLRIQHLSIASPDALDTWVKQQILVPGRLRQIDEAIAKSTRRGDSSPDFEVNVHLVTPGPDVFASSRDHTLRAAFTKLMALPRVTTCRREISSLRKTKSQRFAPAAKTPGELN
jgi:hypothetical protein